MLGWYCRLPIEDLACLVIKREELGMCDDQYIVRADDPKWLPNRHLKNNFEVAAAFDDPTGIRITVWEKKDMADEVGGPIPRVASVYSSR